MRMSSLQPDETRYIPRPPMLQLKRYWTAGAKKIPNPLSCWVKLYLVTTRQYNGLIGGLSLAFIRLPFQPTNRSDSIPGIRQKNIIVKNVSNKNKRMEPEVLNRKMSSLL